MRIDTETPCELVQEPAGTPISMDALVERYQLCKCPDCTDYRQTHEE